MSGVFHFFPCTLLCQLQDTFCRTCWSFLICTPAIGRFAERSECGPTIAGFFLPASVPFTASRVNVEWEGGRRELERKGVENCPGHNCPMAFKTLLFLIQFLMAGAKPNPNYFTSTVLIK